MASLRERIKIIVWFLERPRLYPELMRYSTRRIQEIGRDRKKEARESTALCERVQVDATTALRQIIGVSRPPVSELFPNELATADATLRAAPVPMHGAGNLDLIYHLTDHVQATRAIETGVSAGWSSLAFLLSMTKRAGSMLVSTDMPYPGSSQAAQECVGIVVPDHMRSSWKLIDAPDRDSLPQALKLLPEIDIAHYDSDKSYAARLWAYRQLWAALRTGGILISDDIDDNLGFFHFCGEVLLEPVVVKMPASKGSKYIGILTKPSKSPGAS